MNTTEVAKTSAVPMPPGMCVTGFEMQVVAGGKKLTATFKRDGASACLELRAPHMNTADDAVALLHAIADDATMMGAQVTYEKPVTKVNGGGAHGLGEPHKVSAGIAAPAVPAKPLQAGPRADSAAIQAGCTRFQDEVGVHPAKVPHNERFGWFTAAQGAGFVTPEQLRTLGHENLWEHVIAHAPAGWFAKTAALLVKPAEDAPAAKPDKPKRASRAPKEGKVGGAWKCSPQTTAEIKAAYGVGPAMLDAAERERLVVLGLDDDLIDSQDGADEQWAILLDVAPAGWFTAAAKRRPTHAEENAQDPAGLVGPGGGDPDEPSEEPAEEETECAAAADDDVAYDLEYMQAPERKFYDVLRHLVSKGYSTFDNLLAICNYLQPDVPIMRDIADMADRIKRTCSIRGITLQG